jgi:hypothetical protein
MIPITPRLWSRLLDDFSDSTDELFELIDTGRLDPFDTDGTNENMISSALSACKWHIFTRLTEIKKVKYWSRCISHALLPTLMTCYDVSGKDIILSALVAAGKCVPDDKHILHITIWKCVKQLMIKYTFQPVFLDIISILFGYAGFDINWEYDDDMTMLHLFAAEDNRCWNSQVQWLLSTPGINAFVYTGCNKLPIHVISNTASNAVKHALLTHSTFIEHVRLLSNDDINGVFVNLFNDGDIFSIRVLFQLLPSATRDNLKLSFDSDLSADTELVILSFNKNSYHNTRSEGIYHLPSFQYKDEECPDYLVELSAHATALNGCGLKRCLAASSRMLSADNIQWLREFAENDSTGIGEFYPQDTASVLDTLALATKPWSPSRAHLFGATQLAIARQLLLVRQRLLSNTVSREEHRCMHCLSVIQAPKLPALPTEIWFHIMGFLFDRSNCAYFV